MNVSRSHRAFRCGSCGAALEGDFAAGTKVRCGACGTPVVVPGKPAPRLPVDDGDEPETPFRAALADDELDLTPMVDVTFLLLIFFMLTASFEVQRALQIPPPDPEQQGVTQSLELEDLTEDSVIVTIEPGEERDALFVDDAELDSPDALASELAAAMRDGRRGELVVVAADEARHATVVAVVDAGQAVGMERIRLAAAP